MKGYESKHVSWGTRLKSLLTIALIAATLSTGGAQFEPPPSDSAVSESYPLVFPVAGEHSYTNTFGAPRSGGRTHQGTDIFAEKGTPVVAAADGTIVRMAIGELSGRYLVLQHTDGWFSYYLHLNNDSPGTDDGLGGEWIVDEGAVVAAGDLLDYVGDSGNAEDTPSHLHFELRTPDGTAVGSYPHLRAAQGAPVQIALPVSLQGAGRIPEYEEIHTEMVGHFNPGGGFTADVVVHETTAYLGTWGRPGLCPNTGVRTVDVTDPEEPELIGTFAGEFPATAAETLWVGPVTTASFEGSLAVVALRLCDNDESGRRTPHHRGLAFYDVTDVDNPELLAAWHSGQQTQGANSVSVTQRPDGTLLVATTIRQSFLHTNGLAGDVRFIDATDPTQPIELADWDNRSDGRPVEGDHDDEELHAHSVVLSPDGMQAWVSHWDAGTILLDLSNATEPRFESAAGFMAGYDGNRHSAVVDPNTGILIANAESFDPGQDGEAWGSQHIYAISDLEAPVEVATFATNRSAGTQPRLDGIYTAHDTVLDGTLAITSWYSDGVRIVDLSDPAHPEEVGAFIPPRSRDPVDYWVAPDGTTAFPLVWGVDVSNDLIFASDMNSGLWIIRYLDPSTTDEPGPSPG